jgi:plastocyanin
MSKLILRAGAFATAALAFAGCGEAGGDAMARTGARVHAASAPSAHAASATVTVRIADFAFKPGTVRIRRGTRVRWVNHDAANHTVTFRRGPGDLGNLDQGQSRSVRFRHAGRFSYVCTYHPSMRAKVVVK